MKQTTITVIMGTIALTVSLFCMFLAEQPTKVTKSLSNYTINK